MRGTSWVCCCISLALRWSSCSPTAMPTPGGACARDPLHDPRGLRREKAVREREPLGAACSPCPAAAHHQPWGAARRPRVPPLLPRPAQSGALRAAPAEGLGPGGAGRARPPQRAVTLAPQEGTAGSCGDIPAIAARGRRAPPPAAAVLETRCRGTFPDPCFSSHAGLEAAPPPRPRAVTRSLVAAAVLFQGPRSSAVCAGQRGARRLPWGSSWEGGTGGCLNAGSPRVKASPSLCLRPSVCSLRAD